MWPANASVRVTITATDLARTHAQRRFDALQAIFVAAASTSPAARAPEPVVVVIVDQTTFEAAVAAMATVPASRCETIDGVPVDPLDAVTPALIGRVRRVVFGTASCVIDLGTASRVFRGASRLAAFLQGGTRCLWPGCGLPHCQVDHDRPWTALGATDVANGVPLCGRHNRWKTRGDHTWRDDTGAWHVQRPDGTEIRLTTDRGRARSGGSGVRRREVEVDTILQLTPVRSGG